MNLDEITEPRLLVPRLLSDRQEGAIQELAKRLEATGRISQADAFVDAVLKREREVSTFVGSAAVPHARGGAIEKLSLAVGLAPAGIAWGDKRNVTKAIFLCAVPLTETRAYLALLSALSRLIQDERAVDELLDAAQPEEMLHLLERIKREG